MTTMRRFNLIRDVDESGVSGTGTVAEGVQFSNGRCALTWLTQQHQINGDNWSSVGVYASIEAVDLVHGHGGLTRIVFEDE